MGSDDVGKRAGPSTESDFASDYSADVRAPKAARIANGAGEDPHDGGGDELSSSLYGSDMVPLESSSHNASGHASAAISPKGSPRAESSSTDTDGADMMQQTATFVLPASAVRAAETPRAQAVPPKFVFGSAAKTMVSFTALADAKPADLSQGGSIFGGPSLSRNESTSDGSCGGSSEESDDVLKASGEGKSASGSEAIGAFNVDGKRAHNGDGLDVFSNAPVVSAEALPTVETRTGEEEDEVRFSARAKLFALLGADGGAHEWRERGTGVVHLNESRTTGCGRVVMRADSVLRVILNVRLFEGMRYEPMQARSVRLSVLAEDGAVEHYLLRFRAPEEADAFVFELAVYCDGVPRDS